MVDVDKWIPLSQEQNAGQLRIGVLSKPFLLIRTPKERVFDNTLVNKDLVLECLRRGNAFSVIHLTELVDSSGCKEVSRLTLISDKIEATSYATAYNPIWHVEVNFNQIISENREECVAQVYGVLLKRHLLEIVSRDGEPVRTLDSIFRRERRSVGRFLDEEYARGRYLVRQRN